MEKPKLWGSVAEMTGDGGRSWLIVGVLLSLSCLAPAGTEAQAISLEQALFNLPHISFEAMEPPPGFEASYELRISQPIDHDNRDRGRFLQRAFLNHRGFDRPTVLITNGYTKANNRISEPTHLLDANEVTIEHRFFGVSVPDSSDWSTLDLRQAAGDHHVIRMLLGAIYTGPWVASGVSKGGLATIAYGFFYPEDVSASIPYVAPVQTTFEDQRIYDFLNTAGTPECRSKHLALQRYLLSERDEALPRLQWFARGTGLSFEYLGVEAAFEYAVLEYPFSFWQWGWDCDAVPQPGESEEQLDLALEHIIEVVGLSLYSDEGIDDIGAHYYQAATQTGYYGFETEPFADLLEALPPEPHAAFVPPGFGGPFDPSVLTEISDWVNRRSENFIFLYGAMDTWTAGAVELTGETNSISFTMEGRHHGDARVRNLPPGDKERMRTALERWLGIRLDRERWGNPTS
jgi:hypothetical protein